MDSEQDGFTVCDDVQQAVRLMQVAAAILDGAEEYVASAYLMQALHYLASSGHAPRHHADRPRGPLSFQGPGD